MAKPINKLLVGTSRSQGRSSPPIVWTPLCGLAFQHLKQKLFEAPVLAYANFELPFVLYMDASILGLGTVLAQQNGGACNSICKS